MKPVEEQTEKQRFKYKGLMRKISVSADISLQYPHEDKAVQERQQAEKINTYLMEVTL